MWKLRERGPPRTTVIVCCHLVERWDLLIRALDSLAAQEHRPDQIVVVDGDDDLYDRIIARGGPELSHPLPVRRPVAAEVGQDAH
ncbi:hypothetical protein BBK14_11690 [Parafrankia soli]|uniref:Glycosyltransferase 2-like domain-containing protein n=1 Tax=Parafrankia soli TaxID=2599596 RepID=A0A1S1R3Z6_9ACTN|nr:hypothetical protein [Parafrankia soli]OHV40910.1 hypothetical protein BBK14_11690 [Parafrankia soli]